MTMPTATRGPDTDTARAAKVPAESTLTRLLGRTVAASAYKGAWLGLVAATVLTLTEPFSETATGAAIAACFIGGAIALATLHIVIASRRPGRVADRNAPSATAAKTGRHGPSEELRRSGKPRLGELRRHSLRRRSRRRMSAAVLCLLAGTAVLAATGCSPAKKTFKVFEAPKVTVSATTDPVAACTNLFPVQTLSHFLGYQSPSGVTLDTTTTQLLPPPNPNGPWGLLCGFVDNDNPQLGYQVCITRAVKDGRSGLVKANGVNVSGISTGVTPLDDRHLVPLFGGTTLRVAFT